MPTYPKLPGHRPWILDSVKGCALPLVSPPAQQNAEDGFATARHAEDARRVWPDVPRVAYVVKKVELATVARLGAMPQAKSGERLGSNNDSNDGGHIARALYSEEYSHVLRVFDNVSAIDVLLRTEYCMEGGTFMNENDWLEITSLDYGKLVKLSGVELRVLPVAVAGAAARGGGAAASARFILVANKVEIVNAVSTNLTGTFPDASADDALALLCDGADRGFVLNVLALDPGPMAPTFSECEYPPERSEAERKAGGGESISESERTNNMSGPNCPPDECEI